MRSIKHFAKRLPSAVQYRFRLVLFELLARPASSEPMVKLGSESAGWVFPADRPVEGWICYCVGVGRDISFDLALASRGAEVYSFDPTPRSLEYVESLEWRDEAVTFIPKGVWISNGEIDFYEPASSSHVSFSAVNLQSTSNTIKCEVRTMRSLMRELGHGRVDLVKLDIEGAQYAVLDSMVADSILPKVICVEFDQPSSFRDMLGAKRRLEAVGYSLEHFERWNFTFIRREPVDGV